MENRIARYLDDSEEEALDPDLVRGLQQIADLLNPSTSGKTSQGAVVRPRRVPVRSTGSNRLTWLLFGVAVGLTGGLLLGRLVAR
jgi:hypothetical protein